MRTAPQQLRAIVERIQTLDEEIKSLNDDKRDIYAEAKGNGFDVKALKSVISYLRKDPDQAQEHDAIVSTYLLALGVGTDHATRAPAREAEVPSNRQTVAADLAPSSSTAAVTSIASVEIDTSIPDYLRRNKEVA